MVSELGERQAVAGLAVQTLLHAVFGHHVVYGDVLADFAGEVEEREVLHPVVIVHQLGMVGSVAVEIQESGQLLFDAGHVVAQRFFVEQVAFLAFTRRVAYHSGGASDKGQRLVPATLEMLEHHHAAKMAYVQGVRRGVDAQVGGDLFFFK